jgi:putative ABC transport system permease protein
MFPIYLKIAIRNLFKDKTFSLINLAGLTIGLATAGLLLLWVQNELGFDKYHKESEKIFRINCHIAISPDETWHWSNSPLKLRDFVPDKIPEVRLMAQQFSRGNLTFKVGQEYFKETKAVYVDENWFKIFSYHFIDGSKNSFHESPRNIILTRTAARKYFGNRKAMGEIIGVNQSDHVVAGIIEDTPANSSFDFDCFIPMSSRFTDPKVLENDNNFNNFNYQTYLLLNSPGDVKAVCEKLNDILTENKEDNNVTTSLQAITDIRFNQEIQDDGFDHQDRQTVGIFGLIGLLTLLTACINYVNLSTARAGNRTKEVGIKKVVGASTFQIFNQLMFETTLMSLAAIGMAVFLMQLFLEKINVLADTRIPMDFGNPSLWLLLGGATLLSILVAGIYPALMLSGFKPVSLIKSDHTKVLGKSGLRKILVVMQFTLSIMLIICTLVISGQLHFIKNKKPGYERDQVLSLQPQINFYDENISKKQLNGVKAMFSELKSLHQVVAASKVSQSLVSIYSTHQGSLDWKGKDPDFDPSVTVLNADDGLQSVFGVTMASGRWFRPDVPYDHQCFIINETAVRNFNIPEPVVGRPMSMNGDTGVVVGVVKDFHYKSMHEAILPAVITNRPESGFTILLKLNPGNTAATLKLIETKWRQYFPDQPFQYTFQDDAFDKLHRKEAIMGLLFRFFAGVLIFISCLGLLGLAAYSVERRTKEIGIRKVLGSSVSGIILLISKDFIQLVLISMLLASPVAWYFMQQWLKNFAYRIEISWWPFFAAGVAALTMAMFTVSFQSIRAARSNPVRSLRSE